MTMILYAFWLAVVQLVVFSSIFGQITKTKRSTLAESGYKYSISVIKFLYFEYILDLIRLFISVENQFEMYFEFKNIGQKVFVAMVWVGIGGTINIMFQ